MQNQKGFISVGGALVLVIILSLVSFIVGVFNAYRINELQRPVIVNLPETTVSPSPSVGLSASPTVALLPTIQVTATPAAMQKINRVVSPIK